MKSGLETVPGLEENLRFTSYSLDPVIGKYFAQARFYDSRCGRMLSPDPVKRGLNSYHYCNDDPVNYEDSTGEIANILIGGALGAITGGAFGSSVGLPAALAADFVAGTVGSRGQGYNGGYAGALIGRAGSFSPYAYGRDLRSSCGGSRQTGKSLCYTTSRGYQYGATQTKETKSGKKYSLLGFVTETLLGGVMGGLTGAAFYGGDKVADKLKNSIYSRRRSRTKAEILAANKKKGAAYEKRKFRQFKRRYSDAQTQVTVKTPSGVSTRLDAIGFDKKGRLVIREFKSSKTAPLTKNQEKVFLEILHSDAVGVGKGKGDIFKKGFVIKPGTDVKVIRPIFW